jgi:hypothetical protein
VQEKIREVEGKKKSLEEQVSTLKVEKESAQKSAQPTTAQPKTVLDSEYQELSSKLLSTEQQLTKTQTSMKELLSQVEQKNTAIQVFRLIIRLL